MKRLMCSLLIMFASTVWAQFPVGSSWEYAFEFPGGSATSSYRIENVEKVNGGQNLYSVFLVTQLSNGLKRTDNYQLYLENDCKFVAEIFQNCKNLEEVVTPAGRFQACLTEIVSNGRIIKPAFLAPVVGGVVKGENIGAVAGPIKITLIRISPELFCPQK